MDVDLKGRGIKKEVMVGIKGSEILNGFNRKNSGVYKGILELMSRFGYLSIMEVMYGYGLSLQDAFNRISYLKKIGLIEEFPSLRVPKHFYCLTKMGRQEVQLNHICEEINYFSPSFYHPSAQEHHRSLIKIYIALKKILKEDFLGYVSEATLKREAFLKLHSRKGKGVRVFDAEFLMRIHKHRYQMDANGGEKEIGTVDESWRCALELELSMKSADRYRKQFRDLAGHVYDTWDKQQRIPLILFLYSTRTVYDRLIKFLHESDEDFGQCVFVFGQIDQFLKELEEAKLINIIGSNLRYLVPNNNQCIREINGREINHVRVGAQA